MTGTMLRREVLKVGLGGAALGLFGSGVASAQGQTLTLGALYPLTGPLASFGI